MNSMAMDLPGASRPCDADIVQAGLRDALLASVREHHLTLVVAPPVSGKASVVRQVRGCIDGLDSRPRVEIVENFSRLPAALRAGVVRDIAADAGARTGRRWLVTSDQPLDDVFVLERMRGTIAQFGLRDLALTDSELPRFLGADLSSGIPERVLRGLNVRTAGWVGAWAVLRRLLQSGHAASDLLRTFSGRDRAIAAYFDQYVVPMLAPDVVQLLRDVAPLAQVSAEVAGTVTGRADCGSLLRAAVRDCSFVDDLDRNGDRQGLHPLFRDYLAGVARREDAPRFRALTARYGELALAQGEWLEAARLLSESGSTDRAAQILQRYADDLLAGRGEVASFRQVMASLPRDVLQRTSLAAELALGSIFAGDFAGAAAMVEQAYGAGALGEDQRARLEAITISIDYGLERFACVKAAAGPWLDRHAMVEPRYRAIVAVALFWSCLSERDSAGAYRALAMARADVGKARAPFLDGWLTIVTATHKVAHGQVGAALEALAESAVPGMIGRTGDLLRAALAYETGQFDRARQLMRASLHMGLRHSVVETSLFGWSTAARLAVQDGGMASALSVLQEAEALMASRHGERARRLVRLLRATLLLQSPRDDLLPALEVELNAVCDDAIAHDLCASYRETARLALARFHARCGDPRRAISLVQPIQSTALRVNRIGCWGEASLIHAGALIRRGDMNRAMRQAWSAIAALADAGHLSAIADEHVLLAPLIDALFDRAGDEAEHHSPATAAAVMELARRAGRQRRVADGVRPPPDDPAAPVALTETERRVLALAAQGLGNAQVAARLAIGVSTVKWHLRNIFGKLDVRSRTAAFVKVRRLGMDI